MLNKYFSFSFHSILCFWFECFSVLIIETLLTAQTKRYPKNMMMRRKSSFILVYFNVFSIEKSRNKKETQRRREFFFRIKYCLFCWQPTTTTKKLINSTPSHKSNKFVIRVNRKKKWFWLLSCGDEDSIKSLYVLTDSNYIESIVHFLSDLEIFCYYFLNFIQEIYVKRSTLYFF